MKYVNIVMPRNSDDIDSSKHKHILRRWYCPDGYHYYVCECGFEFIAEIVE